MTRRRRARTVLGLAAIFLVTTWVCLLIWAVVPAAILGWDSIALTSDSMTPGLRAGDVVVASPENTTDLGVGTVVVFRDEFGLVTHRIIAVTGDGNYVTKGDGNRRPDSTPVAPEDIVGVGRIRVPFVALPLAWMQQEEWLKLGLWLAAAALALWFSRWADGGGYRGRHRGISIPGSAVPKARSATLSIGMGLLVLTLFGSPARAVFFDITDNSANSLAAASSFGLVLYLHNNPTPPTGDTSSQAVLPLTAASPTAATLYNYDDDRDGDPGLKLAKGSGLSETDPSKHQIWSMAGPVDLDGPASLLVWGAMKDFDTTKRGVVLAALLDCNSGGNNCSTIASGSIDQDPWDSGGTGTWVSGTIDLGTVTHTIAANRTLRVKVVVDGNSGDDMWFAYDTSAYASVLTVGP